MSENDYFVINTIITFIIGGLTVYYYRKADKLENENLRLRNEADEFDEKKGILLLMSLLSRYFILQLHSYKISTGDAPCSESKFILKELQELLDEGRSLMAYKFYVRMFEKYPNLNLLWLHLSLSINNFDLSSGSQVNPQTFKLFFDFYLKIKEEAIDPNLFQNQYYSVTDEAASFLWNSIQKTLNNQ